MEGEEGAIMTVDENQQQSLSLFDTDSPTLIIQEATDIANQLADIVKNKKLYKPIGNKSHVYVEGWTTLGALLGVFPYPLYSKRLDREDEIIYEAKVSVRTLGGVELSTGEAICSNKEDNWRHSDEYAIKSMATTRATSKALRIPLGWIMTLAGYSATPAEEMTFMENQPARTQQPAPNKQMTTNQSKQPPTPKQPPAPVVDGMSSEDEDKVLNEIDNGNDPDSIWDESMPPSEKVQNPEPENVQEGEITPTIDTDNVFADCSPGLIVSDILRDEGKPLTRENINKKAVNLIPDKFTTEDIKEINEALDKAES